MSRFDTLSDFVAVKADLDAGTAAIHDARYYEAHGTLLVLFLSPEIPSWLRDLFCLEPMRELARAYLPTRGALCRMRNRAVSRLTDGDDCPALLTKALILNKALDDLPASHRLLARLDVIAGGFLASCGDAVVTAFAECGEWQRARKYLGDHRAAIASLARRHNEVCATRRHCAAWHVEQLAQAACCVRQVRLVASILRANGEADAAARICGRVLLQIAHPVYRDRIAQEQCDPGVCLRELRAWWDRAQTASPAARERMLELPHSRRVLRQSHPNIAADQNR